MRLRALPFLGAQRVLEKMKTLTVTALFNKAVLLHPKDSWAKRWHFITNP
jgi:hypothetical protein